MKTVVAIFRQSIMCCTLICVCHIGNLSAQVGAKAGDATQKPKSKGTASFVKPSSVLEETVPILTPTEYARSSQDNRAGYIDELPLPVEEMSVLASGEFYTDGEIGAKIVPLAPEVAERAMEALNTSINEPVPPAPSLGTDRVANALFEIDNLRPKNITRLRLDAAFGVNRPDRLEYFWGKQGGPGPASTLEQNVDFTDYRFYNETSLGRSSAFFEIPLRTVSPEVNNSTTGLGDIQVGSKSIMLEGPGLFGMPLGRPTSRFQIASVFRTHISVAPALTKRGLSTGHLALEPGLLMHYAATPQTSVQSEIKYWIPISGTKGFAGDVLRYGIGVSHVLYSGPCDFSFCNEQAIIPTLEIVGWEFLSGMQTLPDGSVAQVNNASAVNLIPGIRWELGDRADVGMSYAFRVSDERLYNSLLRFELRWFR